MQSSGSLDPTCGSIPSDPFLQVAFVKGLSTNQPNGFQAQPLIKCLQNAGQKQLYVKYRHKIYAEKKVEAYLLFFLNIR